MPVPPPAAIDAQPPFVRVAGIYPHLTAWNHAQRPGFGQPCECGIGAVVPWAGRLWFLTYDSHCLYEGDDRLFSVDDQRRIAVHPASAGGTHACRMIHAPSRQLFIGCYAIDAEGRVRVIDRRRLPGRLTAVARHLREPERKVYYYTQECSLYEVDVATLEPTLLFAKPLPGWHAKGAYTAQGRLVVAHNGEEVAPSPLWPVDWSDRAATARAVEPHLRVTAEHGPEELGVLGEFDGEGWRVVSRRQHTDVAGPGGLTGEQSPDAPVWSQGWDRRSVLLHVRHQGAWHRYRLPKGSYTYDGFNGSYTEWPRFREVGDGRWLMTMHGTIFAWPAEFRPGRTGGIRPVCTHESIIPDFCRVGDELVLAGQDASRIGVPWAVPGLPHSNLQFVRDEELPRFGPRRGFGGPWLDTPVAAGTASDPFLVEGYDGACLHLAHDAAEPVTIAVEGDAAGDGAWRELARIAVAPGGVVDHRFAPAVADARWIRLRADRACTATGYLHLDSPRQVEPGDAAIFVGLAGDDGDIDVGLLHVAAGDHDLRVLTRRIDGDGRPGPERLFAVDERLAVRPDDDAAQAETVRREAASTAHVHEDAASLIAVGADGRRYRLPRLSRTSRRLPFLPRDVREVVQERSLANLGGTFYEIPRHGIEQPSELRNLPDYARMRPIASHTLTIADFAVWRGLLVLSGVRVDAAADGRIFGGEDCRLWFGALDDLWRLGAPRGVGGPWLDTPVAAGVPSDPCLLTGFAGMQLRLSHRAAATVRMRIEADVAADGVFHAWRSVDVPRGETVIVDAPAGWAAHWLRLVPERSTVATARLILGGADG